MSTTARCPECGHSLAEGTADGLCPACLIGALESFGEAAGTSVGSTGPPSLTKLLPIPGYMILAELARGGMGIVYRARQLAPDREVALKMLLPVYAPSRELRERFKLETRTLSELDHPAILPIYETGEFDGLPWFSMKLATGRSLAERRTDFEGRWGEISQLIATLAEAVHYAHERGVLHRDLKPGNVLFDASGRPFVSDFGLAKLVEDDEDFTQSLRVLGTPHYLAPEIAGGSMRNATVASDVYSIGAILWELLAGAPPFTAESLPALLRKIIEEDVEAPSFSREKPPAVRIPRDLEIICRRCLEKQPTRRYVSARELVEELRRFLLGKPILARSVSAPEKLLRWCRRRPVHAAALALLIVIAIGSPIAAWQIEESRRTAERHHRQAEASLYAADMNLALQAAESGNYRRTLELLRRHLPKPGEPDPRSFEWRYLRLRAEDDAEFDLGFHGDAVRQVIFSADGRTLVSRSMDGTAKLWDVEKRREVITLTNVFLLGGFSLDGKSLFYGTKEATVAQVSASTGKPEKKLEKAGMLVRVVNDGNKVATTGPDFRLKLWDFSTGQLERFIPGPGGGAGYRGASWDLSVAVTPDGSRLASVELAGDFSGGLSVWDVQSAALLKRCSRALDGIDSMFLSDDGRFVAIVLARTGNLAVWDWAHEAEPKSLPPGVSQVRAVAFSSDGVRLATATMDESLRLWQLPELTLLATYRNSQVSPWSIAFSPDGQYIAAGGQGEPIRFWNLEARADPDTVTKLPALLYTKNQRTRIAFSADSKWIAPASLARCAPILNCDQLTIATELCDASCVLRFSADGRRAACVGPLASGTGEGPIMIWDRVAGPGQKVEASSHTRSQASEIVPSLNSVQAAVSPDLKLAAIPWIQGDGVTLLDVNSGRPIKVFNAHRGLVSDLMFLPHGYELLTAGSDGVIKFWAIPSAELLFRFTGHTEGIISLDVSPTGGFFASASADKTVRLWDVARRREVNRFAGYRQSPLCVAFSPDEKLLAIGSADATVTLLSVPLWQELGVLRLSDKSTSSPDKAVRAVAFSPDNTVLAARATDGTLRVWRATDRQEFSEMEPQTYPTALSSATSQNAGASGRTLR